jgi:2-polyprenyl-6-methoxyphenol hydroxylase-like FAD-dependent oxidoreductase
MLGFLLARAGLRALVLEKHQDFFRDFRGDTIHSSTLDLLDDLGLLTDFLSQPHQEVRDIGASFGGDLVHIADFSHLPSRSKFIALMPQWDFLNFLAKHAQRFPGFALSMGAEVVDLRYDGERVSGVSVHTQSGEQEISARLVVGADGRSSTVRQRAGLEVADVGAPIDVLWFRVTKKPDDPPQSFGFIGVGQFMVLIDRADYWQCAYVIEKGGFVAKRANGLAAFRAEIARCTPFLGDRVHELGDWNDIKLLTVKIDYLQKWYREGLLCIGDAAHAMSPIGGVGINLAIQDAVATANLLAPKLSAGDVSAQDLASVQRRREPPARQTQRLQAFLHERVLAPIFASRTQIAPPWAMRMLEKIPPLRHIPAHLVGIGFLPEHPR